MNIIEKMTERLRKESLRGYSGRVEDPAYNQAITTLSFLQKAFTSRIGERSAVVPLHLVQSICSLGIIGFEDVGGFQEDKRGIPSVLDNIWLLFTTTLIHHVREQEEEINSPLYFGCYKIPKWFIEDSKSLQVFKYFE